MTSKINCLSCEKKFFSEEFYISLRFSKNATVYGRLERFPTTLKLAKEFTGLYSQENSKFKITFFLDWSNVNLTAEASTCFYGEIFNYTNDLNCLVLRWLQSNESFTHFGPFIHQDLEILIDRADKDINHEIKKIIPLIPIDILDCIRPSNHIFQSIGR